MEEFNSEPSPPSLPPSPPGHSVLSRRRRIARVLTNFIFGQGASQGISILISLFLVRKLSVEAYAQFGLATGFHMVFGILMDMGFASSIVPLVGERAHDRALMGRYVRAARHLRNYVFWILAPAVAVAFFATMHRRHWSLTVQLILFASVLLSLQSAGKVSFYSAPLFALGRLREYYLPQVFSGVTRLTAYIVLAFTGGLNACTAAGLGAINIAVNGTLIGRATRKYIDWPRKNDPKTDRELLNYILPATPAIIFSAFQAQISLFLISYFGGILNIAEVTALNRIGQIFAVLTTFNTIVIEPYIARISQARLLRNFLGFVLAASVAMAPFVFVAFRWPQVFLFILGSKYEGVRNAMGWYVLSACMNFVSGLMWIMNRARKWVFWSGSLAEIGLLLAVQTAFVLYVGVRTTQQAVFFTLAQSCCFVVAHTYVSIVGFRSNRRSRKAAIAA